MRLFAVYHLFEEFIARGARLLEPLFTLSVRAWVGWVFIKSGWLKFSSYENTLYLFQEEYHVPLIPPEVAAVVGTAGELGFGALVLAGLAGRLGPLGLSAVNLMAVVSYSHVLFADGFEAALGQHVLWGFMLLVLVVHGPGRWSLDGLFARWRPALYTGSMRLV